MTLAFGRHDIPYLPRGVRIHHDRVRGQNVLLAPEKAIELDEIGLAILSRVDGDATFDQIIASLAAAYDAPAERIEEDVQQFLTGLRARVYVMVRT
ncbi:pyrroloquinoline quinone biosynthesis protein PqqE [Roseobacter sp. AzwK-3b]|uniref:pyrroloquinoline quinone biosynthesis peptide chaperone PqqD n=1 Tax=Roseobacter sp. AzwK-3b TaxID=351016 RepID=UPI0001569866|nr:pyrroloquinoline quinone biosynthesis peptide chaperone PqqD [Roseobacter sp. AzwK-3b]EDM71324.1 pyrroloquinoline quinone biosynthesis protein PqqE [Roseobacter sp. AzwK-3b]